MECAVLLACCFICSHPLRHPSFSWHEPEAFLHPPQARLLGQIIAQGFLSEAQLFFATHSPDVIAGLMDTVPDRLRIFRIQRDCQVNHVKELEPAILSRIASDPLMKSSSVISGLFHERVIVCESHSDSVFYSALLDTPVGPR